MCNKSVIVFYVILQRIKQKTVWSKWFYKETENSYGLGARSSSESVCTWLTGINTVQDSKHLVCVGINTVQDNKHLVCLGTNTDQDRKHLVFLGINTVQDGKHLICLGITLSKTINIRSVCIARTPCKP